MVFRGEEIEMLFFSLSLHKKFRQLFEKGKMNWRKKQEEQKSLFFAEEKLHQIFETLLPRDFLPDKSRNNNKNGWEQGWLLGWCWQWFLTCIMVIVMRMRNVLGDQKFSTGLPRGQKQRVSSVLRQKTSAKSYYDDKDERRVQKNLFK